MTIEEKFNKAFYDLPKELTYNLAPPIRRGQYSPQMKVDGSRLYYQLPKNRGGAVIFSYDYRTGEFRNEENDKT